MKSRYTIELVTSNMKEIIEESEDGKETDVSGDVEAEIHNLLALSMEQKEFIKGFEELVLSDELTELEDAKSLSDYGDVKLTVIKEE